MASAPIGSPHHRRWHAKWPNKDSCSRRLILNRIDPLCFHNNGVRARVNLNRKGLATSSQRRQSSHQGQAFEIPSQNPVLSQPHPHQRLNKRLHLQQRQQQHQRLPCGRGAAGDGKRVSKRRFRDAHSARWQGWSAPGCTARVVAATPERGRPEPAASRRPGWRESAPDPHCAGAGFRKQPGEQ